MRMTVRVTYPMTVRVSSFTPIRDTVELYYEFSSLLDRVRVLVVPRGAHRKRTAQDGRTLNASDE